ncbi:MAG: transglycosylase SLT domain-containing protein [Gemmatimonas sp.]
MVGAFKSFETCGGRRGAAPLGRFVVAFALGAYLAAGMAGIALAQAKPTTTASKTPGVPGDAFPPLSLRVEGMLDALNRRDFTRAYNEAAALKDPVLTKLVAWASYRTPGNRASFSEIARFLDENPEWPDSRTLRRNAEANIELSLPSSQILAWLDEHPPLTARGRIARVAALESAGRTAEARDAARAAWRDTNFSESEEKEFLSRFRKHLTREDHAARLDRLIWDGRAFDARRELRLVDPDTQALANARLALRRLDPGVDGLLKRVPATMQSHPGLLYERLRWRRVKGRDMEARDLLDHAPKDLGRPEMWWDERAIQVRRALSNGEASVAYRLASHHGLSRGAAFADAEFLSGWIALRFLGNAEAALRHFEALHANVSFPVSVARGAYWAGRAAEALNDEEGARNWYAKAAAYPTVFYGQVARARIEDTSPPSDPAVTSEEAKAFARDELVRAARIVARSPDRTLLRWFVVRLVDRAKTPAEHRLIAALAQHEGRPDVAVAAAKASARRGVILVEAGYPERPLPPGADTVERELAHAVIRQESAFDAQAISGAGARGLMQLIGPTAQHVAKMLKLPFDRERLTNDPDYNVRLGTRYLADLVDQFGGSYVLAVAAYNAGPSRVRTWSRNGGDPRKGALDVLDWIEMIPISETRDYVQRVIENLEVYRARHSGVSLATRLKEDLSRGAHVPVMNSAEAP